MFKKILLMLTAFLLGNQVTAQVSDPKFDRMLRLLISENVPQIQVKEAVTQGTAVFLDAREREEFKVSHIENARWVGYKSFEATKVQDLDKNAEIIVYCSVGYRSEKVGKQLEKLGFTNVRNLYGGLFEWHNMKYPIVNMQGQRTQKIHTYNKMWSKYVKRGVKVYE